MIAATADAADIVRIKNARELYASYASIMNLSESDPALRDSYKAAIDRLPKNGTPDELSNPMIMASTDLGGVFCKAALDKEKALTPGRRVLFGDVNFRRGPSQFIDGVRNAMLDHLANAFWYRDATSAEKNSLSKTMAAAVQNNVDSADETVSILQILCTSYATSLAFFVK